MREIIAVAKKKEKKKKIIFIFSLTYQLNYAGENTQG